MGYEDMNFTTTCNQIESKYFSQLKLQLQSLSPPTLPENFTGIPFVFFPGRKTTSVFPAEKGTLSNQTINPRLRDAHRTLQCIALSKANA